MNQSDVINQICLSVSTERVSSQMFVYLHIRSLFQWSYSDLNVVRNLLDADFNVLLYKVRLQYKTSVLYVQVRSSVHALGGGKR